MTVGNFVSLLGLFGGKLLTFSAEDRGLLQVLALCAMIASLVVVYLWWKVLGALFRLALLALAVLAGVELIRQTGLG